MKGSPSLSQANPLVRPPYPTEGKIEKRVSIGAKPKKTIWTFSKYVQQNISKASQECPAMSGFVATCDAKTFNDAEL